MLLAIGEFETGKVIEAAAAMARGETCPYPAPSEDHPHGFGLLWSDPNAPTGFCTLRNSGHLGSQSAEGLLEQGGQSLQNTRMLAIHARFATQPEKLGPAYSHPLQAGRESSPVFFMHNGYTPEMHRVLEETESRFDSEEYFRVVQSLMPSRLNGDRVSGLLEPMGKPTTSGNFFLITKTEAVAFNWWPKTHIFGNYCQMHRYQDPGSTIIASDRLIMLAPFEEWSSIARGDLLRLPLTQESTELEKGL